MPRVGDQLTGPSQTLRIEALEPDLLSMEAGYAGGGAMPPMHFHPSQTETFTVLDGSVRTIIDGRERVFSAGETFEVLPGIGHQMTGEGPARMRWEVRPALRTAEFLERLFSGNAGENFLDEFKDEIRFG